MRQDLDADMVPSCVSTHDRFRFVMRQDLNADMVSSCVYQARRPFKEGVGVKINLRHRSNLGVGLWLRNKVRVFTPNQRYGATLGIQ